MSSIDDVFQKLRADAKKALVPFVTAGDPDLEFTAAVLGELDRRGAAVLEVGIPYSDPIADGPVIQASYSRALERGVTLAGILQMLGDVTPKLAAPVVTMVSYAIVFRHGVQNYVDDARASGVAGLIVPDLPLDEAERLGGICRDAGMSLIQLVTPTTPPGRAAKIAETSTGFLYYVSVAGITGERTALPRELVDNVAALRDRTALPILVGFGISGPEQARAVARAADGAIVGSAFVRRIEAAGSGDRDEVLAGIGAFADELRAALEA